MNYEDKVKNRYWISKYLLDLLYRVTNLEKSSGSGGSQDLQSVMEEGSKYFHTGDTTRILGLSVFQPLDVALYNDINGFTASPDIFQLAAGKEIGISQTVLIGEVVEGKYLDFTLPTTKPSGNYILATIEDIPTSPISGTFLAPTSITIVNGLITAIS